MRSWKSWKLLLACSAVALGSSGCGSSGGSSYDATGEVHRLAEATCGYIFGCCNQGELAYMLGPYMTAETCPDVLTHLQLLNDEGLYLPLIGGELPNLANLDRAAAEGRVRFDRVTLDACIQQLEAFECEPEEPTVDPVEGCVPYEPEELPCNPEDLVVGLVPEGGACDSVLGGEDCAEGLTCVDADYDYYPVLARTKDAGADGTCVALLEEGESCSYDQQCEGDLYCSQVDGTCTVPSAVDEPCQYSPLFDHTSQPDENLLLVRCESHLTCSPFSNTCVLDCAEGARCYNDGDCDEEAGLVCVSRVGGYDGYCDQPRATGAGCFESDDCAAGICDDAEAYDNEEGACTALIADGAPCELDAHDTCVTGYCDPDAGVCDGRVSAPNACPSGTNAQCVEGAICVLQGDAVTYLCEDLAPNGDACAADGECVSGECIIPAGDPEGVCRSLPLANNAVCEIDEQCDSGVCNQVGDPSAWTCVVAPLANGQPCDDDDICSSQVCFEGECAAGATAGDACGGAGLPCDPFTTFCDEEADPPVCTVFAETGEACTREIECRSGNCSLQWNRWMCSPAAPPDELVCQPLYMFYD